MEVKMALISIDSNADNEKKDISKKWNIDPKEESIY